MDADRRNDTGIFRYTDVEYTPEGHTDAYRWDDFLGIAGGHVYSAMDTIDMVSTGGQEGGRRRRVGRWGRQRQAYLAPS